MSQQKTCKQCQKEFTVTDEDLAFYKKMSPDFDGKVFEIPAPTMCPSCRNRHRMSMRNVTNLYKRNCDLCGKEMISMYSPDKTDIKVYCSGCWWSDKWDFRDYGQDYDPNKSFIEQLSDLKKKVPAPALMHADSENSDYTNLANDNKNCYLVFLAGRNEDVCYGYWNEDSKSSSDITYSSFCELCYEVINLRDCYAVMWSTNCGNCRDSYFIEDCNSCSDCILCSCLAHKQYCYKNEQLSPEEYEKVKKEFLSGLESRLDEYKKEFREIIVSQPKKFSQIMRSENCSGDNIFNSKNCHACFMTSAIEDSKYCYDLKSGNDSMDLTGFGIPVELAYESQNIGMGSARCAFISFAYQLADSYNCEHCYYSKNLFGCVGAKNHNEYCILNKQYSREEYEELVAEIIQKMQQAGEWGEFFPPKFSSFGYNETMANEYYPLSREDGIRLGYSWQDNNYDVEFDGSPYQIKPIEVYAKSESQRNELLNGVLKCEKSGRPYKIMPKELLFYIKNNLPIPKIHYMVRMKDRLSRINLFDLYHRQCMCEGECKQHENRCQNEFETTYSPDQPERVYCESCYQKNVL